MLESGRQNETPEKKSLDPFFYYYLKYLLIASTEHLPGKWFSLLDSPKKPNRDLVRR
jgi:hypothetical protein